MCVFVKTLKYTKAKKQRIQNVHSVFCCSAPEPGHSELLVHNVRTRISLYYQLQIQIVHVFF